MVGGATGGQDAGSYSMARAAAELLEDISDIDSSRTVKTYHDSSATLSYEIADTILRYDRFFCARGKWGLTPIIDLKI